MTPLARLAVAGAAGAWVGVGRWWPAAVALVAIGMVNPRRVRRSEVAVLAGALVAGTVLGLWDSRPPEPLAAGPVVLEGRVVREWPGRWGWSGLVDTGGTVVLVTSPQQPTTARIRVAGRSDGRVRSVAGRAVAATVTADRLDVAAPASVHEQAAEALRDRIVDRIRPQESESRALLVGFLVGDTSGVGPVLMDEMRRSGLSHLVAVSGSNVALFVAATMVVAAPLSIHPLGRLVVLVNGLIVFGLLTRWEPSVVRAALMAGLVGVGRFVGVPLEPVTALALVAGGAVLADPGLSRSVGFQLSVLATAGLVVGARWAPGGGAALRLVTATAAAQAAVAPLILAVFGSVPLLAPLANLVAIPLVTVATVAGGVGAAVGAAPVLAIADLCARGVMWVARAAAPWPQLGASSFLALVAAGFVLWRLPAVRGLALVGGSLAVAAMLTAGGGLPDRGIVFLDVGQGDGAIVRLSGMTVVVDGGPDPAALAGRLSRWGVDRVDLVVVSHVHEDHVAGVVGLLGRVPVGRIWASFGPHETPSSRELLDTAGELGIPVTSPAVGTRIEVGPDRLEVLGPLRRYAGANDHSLVLVLTLGDVRVLLSGDIETVAQAELEVPGVDVLKVPHQGAATSDLGWLSRHAGAVAVISVGPNDFGHPRQGVVDALQAAGSVVYRTDRVGDVVVEVGRDGVVRALPSHPG